MIKVFPMSVPSHSVIVGNKISDRVDSKSSERWSSLASCKTITCFMKQGRCKFDAQFEQEGL